VAFRSLVTVWEPARRLGVRLSGGSFDNDMAMDLSYELSSEGADRTMLVHDMIVPLKGAAYRLMGPLIWLLASRNTRNELARLHAFAPTADTGLAAPK